MIYLLIKIINLPETVIELSSGLKMVVLMNKKRVVQERRNQLKLEKLC